MRVEGICRYMSLLRYVSDKASRAYKTAFVMFALLFKQGGWPCTPGPNRYSNDAPRCFTTIDYTATGLALCKYCIDDNDGQSGAGFERCMYGGHATCPNTLCMVVQLLSSAPAGAALAFSMHLPPVADAWRTDLCKQCSCCWWPPAASGRRKWGQAHIDLHHGNAGRTGPGAAPNAAALALGNPFNPGYARSRTLT